MGAMARNGSQEKCEIRWVFFSFCLFFDFPLRAIASIARLCGDKMTVALERKADT
jgi:hypothetical protein